MKVTAAADRKLWCGAICPYRQNRPPDEPENAEVGKGQAAQQRAGAQDLIADKHAENGTQQLWVVEVGF